MTVLRVHGLLLVLHPRVLPNCTTAARPHEKCDTMALERRTTKSIRRTMRQDVCETSPTATEFQENVLLTNGCIGIWCGSHTLTGGRSHEFKTKTPTHHLLLHHL